MSLDFTHNSSSISNIREILSHKGDVALYRQTIILAGDVAWQRDFLQEILSGYENESLWVGNSAPERFTFIEIKNAHSWLGNEKRVVVFDANKDFDPDSFAAVSGIVVGGGLFFLLFPEKNKWNEIYGSYFGQRLIRSINNTSNLTVIDQSNENFKFPSHKYEVYSAQDCVSPFLTIDQQYAVERIEKQVLSDTNIPVVLISDRGRGKSAALGFVVAKLLKSGIKNIAITAPRLRATDIVFKHIVEILPEAEATRGRIKYNDVVFQFYSPDQLVHNNVDVDILLIDEAAAIPVPILTSFLHKYSQCIFATTVHGYEGTGRGFSLRFFKELDKYNSNWIKLYMQTPVRWAENDPLERWMFDLLCLDAEIVDADVLVEIEESKLEYYFLKKEQLFNNELLLEEVFSLLVLAHYRTRPKDLKSLLDDNALSLYVALYDGRVVGVALVVHEGDFSDSLSKLVYQGVRRPQGHLLAQALTYHCGIEYAATLNYARVMRIAIHPNLQEKGIGTKLLDFVIRNEKQHGVDAIGTSFGMNERLVAFWKRALFNVVRIGFTKEQTSGERAAIMLLPLTEQGKKVTSDAQTQFCEQLPYWFDDVLSDIPVEIKALFQIDKSKAKELTVSDKDVIKSFVKYSRNYELCIAALNKLVMQEQQIINQNNFSEDFVTILNEKIIKKKSWEDIAKNMGLNGKADARNLFKKAINYLLEHGATKLIYD